MPASRCEKLKETEQYIKTGKAIRAENTFYRANDLILLLLFFCCVTKSKSSEADSRGKFW